MFQLLLDIGNHGLGVVLVNHHLRCLLKPCVVQNLDDKSVALQVALRNHDRVREVELQLKIIELKGYSVP